MHGWQVFCEASSRDGGTLARHGCVGCLLEHVTEANRPCFMKNTEEDIFDEFSEW